MTLSALTPADTLLISVLMEGILYGWISLMPHVVVFPQAVCCKGCSTVLSAQAMRLLFPRRKANAEKGLLLGIVSIWMLGSIVSATASSQRFHPYSQLWIAYDISDSISSQCISSREFQRFSFSSSFGDRDRRGGVKDIINISHAVASSWSFMFLPLVLNNTL